jgi:hypothetical protein
MEIGELDSPLISSSNGERNSSLTFAVRDARNFVEECERRSYRDDVRDSEITSSNLSL